MRQTFASVAGFALWLLSGAALAAEPDSLLATANQALSTGAYQQAIDNFEALSDQGQSHPNISFNRGVSYALRASSPNALPGDLGQAAAAFEEALALDRSDAEAAAVLERTRHEISKLRAQLGKDPVVARPTLGRAILSLLPENTWAKLAWAGSLLLAVGLSLRLWFMRWSVHIAGLITIVIGGFLLSLGSSLCLISRGQRQHEIPAVVVVSDARLLNEQGLPLPALGANAPEIPEGARIDITEIRGRLAHVLWGGIEGWVINTQLRQVAPR